MKIAILILTVFFSSSVYAMKVACKSDAYLLEQADIAFIGTVTERASIKEQRGGICRTAAENTQCGSKVVTFSVEGRLKGKRSNVVKVFAGDSCYCASPSLTKGSRYILFGTAPKDNSDVVLSMNSCATKPYNAVRAETLKGLVKEKYQCPADVSQETCDLLIEFQIKYS